MRRKHKKEGMDVYTQLNHISGQQELTHHGKATTFQLKNKKTLHFFLKPQLDWQPLAKHLRMKPGGSLLCPHCLRLHLSLLASSVIGVFQLVCVHLTSCLLALASSLKRLAHEGMQYTGWFVSLLFLLFPLFFSFKLLIKFYLKQKSKWGYFSFFSWKIRMPFINTGIGF